MGERYKSTTYSLITKTDKRRAVKGIDSIDMWSLSARGKRGLPYRTVACTSFNIPYLAQSLNWQFA